MSSNPSTATGHEKYYVPESSSLAVRATIGLLLSVFGGGLMLNDMTYGSADERQLFRVGADRGVGFFHSDAHQLV